MSVLDEVYITQVWLKGLRIWSSASTTPTSLAEVVLLQQRTEYECGFVCRVISLWDTNRNYFKKHYPALVPVEEMIR